MEKYISLNDYEINIEATKKISEDLAKRHSLIPIDIKNDILIVAMNDPLNVFAIEDISIYSGMKIKSVHAKCEEINKAIDLYYGKQEALKAAAEYKKEYTLIEEENNVIDKSIADVVNSAPIVKLVNSIIEQAIRMRASDIHVEPGEYNIRIRYRIDGQLEEIMRHELDLLPAVVTRIKIMSNMNIAERRRPQDGRIGMYVDGNEFDLRISIIPTVHGEKVVLRINDKRNFIKSVEELGFFTNDMKTFNKILQNPHGMIVVTGPTGSGKSTTLYTAIQKLNNDNVNIITVEDPVEANIDKINQIQVNIKADITFATALRSILRQDPDIIMIGEIRDSETATIAIRAAVTGHLVLSTLHTNDAPSTITRLIDMGIEPFLIGSSLVASISQRLVRKICSRCKKAYLPTLSEMELLNIRKDDNIVLYKGEGCSFCNNSGYQGRLGVFEIMPISSNIRNLIYHDANADLLRKQAIEEGMSTLQESCRRLVLEGITTTEELIRVSYSL